MKTIISQQVQYDEFYGTKQPQITKEDIKKEIEEKLAKYLGPANLGFSWNGDAPTVRWRADVPGGTTILEISVFHPERVQSSVIAQAISYVLLREVDEYIGVSDVELKIVDAPLTSKFPVRPNLFVNLMFGLVLGFLVAVSYILITYTEDHEARDVYYSARSFRKEKKLVQGKV